MDKDTQDAFKLLTSKIQDGFSNMATKQDLEAIKADMAGMATKQDLEAIKADMAGMATKQDLEAIKADMATKKDLKELEDRIRHIVREEVKDIRNAIEERCKPAQLEK